MGAILNQQQFSQVKDLAYDKWGLVLTENKRTVVENRFQALFRLIGERDVTELVQAIESGGDPRFEQALFDVLSTNHTSFFREQEHYDLLRDEVLAPLRGLPNQKIRIWSAGCSRGCEPYTLSMLIQETLRHNINLDARILATDLCSQVLKEAQRAVYTDDVFGNMTSEQVAQHMNKKKQGANTYYQVKEPLRKRVSFASLNLNAPWPMKGPFDAILCRNVMIYFDAQTRKRIGERMLKLLRPGGLLLLGTSESLPYKEMGMESVMVGAYRREP